MMRDRMASPPTRLADAVARVACAARCSPRRAAACSQPQERPGTAPRQPPRPAGLPPIATHAFPYDPKTIGVVGVLQVTHSRHEDTLADIARRFNLGFDEVVRANPGVDPWLPGEGTRIVLPTQFVLPDAPAEGLVVNVAALRMFYFPKPKKGEQRVVMTFPIGIGKIGWATPIGTTKIVSKRKDPYWTPPASVRKEHEAEATSSRHRCRRAPTIRSAPIAMNLGWPSYLIHGTNKPAGVGLAREPRLHPHVPRGHRHRVRRHPGRHEGDRRQPAVALSLAGRQPVRAVVSAAPR